MQDATKNNGKRILTPDQIKAEACGKAVHEVLNKYGMIMVPIFSFNGRDLDARIQILPRAINVESDKPVIDGGE